MKMDADMRPDIRDVLDAAALLDVTEYTVFDLAYRDWFGERAAGGLLERAFARYMFDDIVPSWVRHYTRTVVQRAERGELDPEAFGVQWEAPDPRDVWRGRVYISVIIGVTLLMWLATAVGPAELLSFAEGCYLPPCY
ncbi:MAG: hypothetical protein GWO02_09215 [Gammaproteobacteria bacterium]|nr:hypothetical protein [Gammaproteobacteria bacterium]